MSKKILPCPLCGAEIEPLKVGVEKRDGYGFPSFHLWTKCTCGFGFSYPTVLNVPSEDEEDKARLALNSRYIG